ncbi:hypothetical protein [Streptomyces djakartensis]|uniref:hypothetical protein n=1 Tax=Streptomyces djakartensis TaxID=68193 RepID=UPI0034E013C1
MPESTVTAWLAQMEPDDAAALAYIRAMQANDIDTAGAVANDTGPEMRRLCCALTPCCAPAWGQGRLLRRRACGGRPCGPFAGLL